MTASDEGFVFMLITFMLYGLAMILFVAEESRGHIPKSSVAYLTVFYPDESVPWDKLDNFSSRPGIFGLGLHQTTFSDLFKLLSSLNGSGFLFSFIPESFKSLFQTKKSKERRQRISSGEQINFETKEKSGIVDNTRQEGYGINIPPGAVLEAYACYLLLFLKGFLRVLVWSITSRQGREHWSAQWWKEFFTQQIYRRVEDCWHRPIASPACDTITVLTRTRKRTFLQRYEPFQLDGESVQCINLASYNYLGFGGPDSDSGAYLIEVLKRYGMGTSCSRTAHGGTLDLHIELEKQVAEFIGKESAMVMGMGFATNSCILPAFGMSTTGKPTLFISDELNHRSIVEGVRASSAGVRSFRHNDMTHLQQILQTETEAGAWCKIIIIIEGIYSMEGEFACLQKIIDLKKKYKAYLWLDEAHSIGAVGLTGRGACEATGTSPADVEIMMGTFTKSFGSNGGYVAASKPILEYLKRNTWGWDDATSMTPICAAKTLSALKVIKSPKGRMKLKLIRDNGNYFRNRLIELGFLVVGDPDSPVVCALILHPEKLTKFSKMCLQSGIAVVIVGYPATPVLLSRVRFCISAAHCIPQLEKALVRIGEIGRQLGVLLGNKGVYGPPCHSYTYFIVDESLKCPDEWEPESLVPQNNYHNFKETDNSLQTKSINEIIALNYEGIPEQSVVEYSDRSSRNNNPLSQTKHESDVSGLPCKVSHVNTLHDLSTADLTDEDITGGITDNDECRYNDDNDYGNRDDDDSVTNNNNNKVKDKIHLQCVTDSKQGMDSQLTLKSFSERNEEFVGSINCCVYDPLCLRSDIPVSLRRHVIRALNFYGVGACGPRGFYGTTHAHLQLETAIVNFIQAESVAVFSHHISTITSVCQAFINGRNDRIIAHHRISRSMRVGLKLAKVDQMRLWGEESEKEGGVVNQKATNIFRHRQCIHNDEHHSTLRDRNIKDRDHAIRFTDGIPYQPRLCVSPSSVYSMSPLCSEDNRLKSITDVPVGYRSELLDRSRVSLVKTVHPCIKELEKLIQEESTILSSSGLPGRVWIVMDSWYNIDLQLVVDLKNRYGVYLLIDDSLGFGAVGDGGRGFCSYYGVKIQDVNLVVGSLEYAIGTIGGFCATDQNSIDHITLYASGYCFSASSPPALAEGATHLIRNMPNERLQRVQEKSIFMHEIMKQVEINSITVPECFVKIVEVNRRSTGTDCKIVKPCKTPVITAQEIRDKLLSEYNIHVRAVGDTIHITVDFKLSFQRMIFLVDSLRKILI